MTDEEKFDGASSHVADWEVVALTASAYAASPGPDGGPHYDSRNKGFHGECGSSNALFMSEHFVFPPHEHENLSVNLGSDEEITYRPGSYIYEFHEDNSNADLCIPNVEYQEEQTKSFLHAETGCREMDPSDNENDIDATYDSPDQNNIISPDFVKFGKTTDGKNDGYSLPCEAWWKRHAMSLYKQAKETNTFWSICVAAALVGLAFIGQQWRREKLQFQQLKLQFSHSNERMSKMLGSVSSHHHGAVIHGRASANL